jgi:SPP1 gp7 family putative phage head morphogenesis protein
MAQQNPSALIAAAQRQNALRNYAAGSKGSQLYAQLNRLADVDLRGRIIGAVEFHLAQGDSWRQLKGTLRNGLAVTSSRAQTIARTEMAAAMVEGTKLRYEAEGVQLVQWQAVGSSRTCSFCAPRHRRAYRLGEVVCPAHPNCRCTLTPWDPEWVELGLVDREEEAKDRAAVMDELRESGKEPNYGPSPFEKALGREEAAEAVWMPPRVGEKQLSAPAKAAEPFTLRGQVLRSGAQTDLVFKAKGGTGAIFENSWAELEAVGGEIGENAKRMRQFVEKQQIVYNLGLPEKFANGERFIDDQVLLKSQRQALAVLESQRDSDPKAAGPLSGARSLSEKLAKGETTDLKYVMGKVSAAAGYTTRDTGIVNAYMTSQSKALDAKGIAKVIAGAENSLRQQNEYIDFYKKNYKAGVTPPKPAWHAGGLPDQDPDGWLSTLIHETGHQIHYRGASATKLGNKYKGLKGETYVSQYAHSKETEQFAEAFVHFVLNPAGLRESHPRLYQWVDDALKEVMK